MPDNDAPQFDLDRLRRWPDVEAPNLFAVDASDRLILDEAAEAVAAAPPGTVVVINDHYGALAIGAAANLGATGVRVFQDALVGEAALAANARGVTTDLTSLPLGESLLSGATVVLLQVPRSLAELDEIAGEIARWADPSVVVYAGGRIKHLSLTMNSVLTKHFGRLDVSLARQKSRVLIAREPRAAASDFPVREYNQELGLWVCAHGAVFAGAKLDLGTRLLLSVLDDALPAAATAIDLGSGTGILAASLARSRPGISVIATDQSAAAVASSLATVEANGLADRVSVVRDDGLKSQPDSSADLIVLNPPFHVGATVHTGLADRLFRDAARVLRPGGELWTVYNSHLDYRPTLQSVIGSTREVVRNNKFTVTSSRRRVLLTAGEVNLSPIDSSLER
ncbi:class I SAM-dependent methyltransferase [Lacisediminihabitans profunda]|uniref:Methyltransferase n=1 Tax=Lacisediminihabitans profunda TaxID=2594790 RepID=A0A5C8UK63_9MICO|nr:class I SAM-dependent methyltransferase [Lacisediminihabitans profunda]TXN28621.1 methyltransferase [Lacisediminihabitans profunda]